MARGGGGAIASSNGSVTGVGATGKESTDAAVADPTAGGLGGGISGDGLAGAGASASTGGRAGTAGTNGIGGIDSSDSKAAGWLGDSGEIWLDGRGAAPFVSGDNGSNGPAQSGGGGSGASTYDIEQEITLTDGGGASYARIFNTTLSIESSLVSKDNPFGDSVGAVVLTFDFSD